MGVSDTIISPQKPYIFFSESFMSSNHLYKFFCFCLEIIFSCSHGAGTTGLVLENHYCVRIEVVRVPAWTTWLFGARKCWRTTTGLVLRASSDSACETTVLEIEPGLYACKASYLTLHLLHHFSLTSSLTSLSLTSLSPLSLFLSLIPGYIF